MCFKLKLYLGCFVVLNIAAISLTMVNAAEWKIEPSINMKAQYNDNVRMRADENNPEGSIGFTLDPRVKFAGEEQAVWDVAIDARGKIIRYQDIEDGDSENAFFVFDGGRQTERSDWRLNTSFERNSNFDTDFDTENPDAGLLDDHTERKTISISPSVSWNPGETSQMSISFNSTNVTYDEKTNLSYEDYDYDSLQFVAYWIVTENHQLGFTSSYAEYESPDASFFYDQTIIQFDYTYTINQVSDVSFSLGGRRLDSLLEDGEIVGCALADEFETFGGCPVSQDPIFANVENEEDGTVVNLSYRSYSETVRHSFTAGRTVAPSSFGGAQEVRNANYRLNVANTERLSTKLLLDASETETISGINSSNDRARYRIEPSISYKLNKDWGLQFLYRYIQQDYTNSDRDGTSNAVFINLFLHWPKLATTY